jgi:hypothetical protein
MASMILPRRFSFSCDIPYVNQVKATNRNIRRRSQNRFDIGSNCLFLGDNYTARLLLPAAYAEGSTWYCSLKYLAKYFGLLKPTW